MTAWDAWYCHDFVKSWPCQSDLLPPLVRGSTEPRACAEVRVVELHPQPQAAAQAAASSTAQVAARSATGGDAPAPSAMSTKELRAALSARGIDYSQCIEKRELVALLENPPAVAPPKAAAAAPRAALATVKCHILTTIGIDR